ncbi:hypothetical protein R3W88_029140 [Solanum pinnatisectum]|uniref:Uncharacterized protein n=1 Tax=Solanum pinnatisectum TaxID=50273 RepID=A0AAV9K6L7_9SOLN|nr:hypothetical protein R3W88_029140 [Solanum pinnatisectum]
MYDANTKYEDLINTISSQLSVYTIIFHLEIKYVVSGPSPPIKIHKDMGVQVYLDQKRCYSDFFLKYLLCVTCMDSAMEVIEYQTGYSISCFGSGNVTTNCKKATRQTTK